MRSKRTREQDLNLVDGLTHDIAMEEAEHGSLTEQEQRDVAAIDATVKTLLRILKGALMPETIAALPEHIRRASRGTLVRELLIVQPQASIEYETAYQKLDRLSDDALRVMLAELTA